MFSTKEHFFDFRLYFGILMMFVHFIKKSKIFLEVFSYLICNNTPCVFIHLEKYGHLRAFGLMALYAIVFDVRATQHSRPNVSFIIIKLALTKLPCYV